RRRVVSVHLWNCGAVSREKVDLPQFRLSSLPSLAPVFARRICCSSAHEMQPTPDSPLRKTEFIRREGAIVAERGMTVVQEERVSIVSGCRPGAPQFIAYFS